MSFILAALQWLYCIIVIVNNRIILNYNCCNINVSCCCFCCAVTAFRLQKCFYSLPIDHFTTGRTNPFHPHPRPSCISSPELICHRILREPFIYKNVGKRSKLNNMLRIYFRLRLRNEAVYLYNFVQVSKVGLQLSLTKSVMAHLNLLNRRF